MRMTGQKTNKAAKIGSKRFKKLLLKRKIDSQGYWNGKPKAERKKLTTDEETD